MPEIVDFYDKRGKNGCDYEHGTLETEVETFRREAIEHVEVLPFQHRFLEVYRAHSLIELIGRIEHLQKAVRRSFGRLLRNSVRTGHSIILCHDF